MEKHSSKQKEFLLSMYTAREVHCSDVSGGRKQVREENCIEWCMHSFHWPKKMKEK